MVSYTGGWDGVQLTREIAPQLLSVAIVVITQPAHRDRVTDGEDAQLSAVGHGHSWSCTGILERKPRWQLLGHSLGEI